MHKSHLRGSGKDLDHGICHSAKDTRGGRRTKVEDMIQMDEAFYHDSQEGSGGRVCWNISESHVNVKNCSLSAFWCVCHQQIALGERSPCTLKLHRVNYRVYRCLREINSISFVQIIMQVI